MKWYKYIEAFFEGNLIISPAPEMPLSGKTTDVCDIIKMVENYLICGGRADYQDANFEYVGHEFFTEQYREYFIKYLDAHMHDNPDYNDRYFDCDDFAL